MVVVLVDCRRGFVGASIGMFPGAYRRPTQTHLCLLHLQRFLGQRSRRYRDRLQ
jgi:hypothetical protein